MSKLIENYRKFGVPLSSSMDIRTISEVWNSSDSTIKEQNAEIDSLIKASLVSYSLAEKLFSAYSIVKKQKDKMSMLIENASAVQQGQTQFPILTAQEMASLEALENSNNTFLDRKDSIF